MKTILALLLILFVAPNGLHAQFSDDFEESTLDNRWTWVREAPGTWGLANDALTIWTEPGALNGRKFNDVRNMLLQPLNETPPDEYTIETRLHFSPYWVLQNAGLLYHVDDDHYIRVSRGINEGRNTIWLEWEIEGETHFRYSSLSFSSDQEHLPCFLRLTCRNGTQFSASYTLSPETGWVAFATETIDLPSAGRHIGLQAANGAGLMATNTHKPAIYEYFHYMAGLSTSPFSSPPVSFSIESIHPSPAAVGSELTVLIQLDRGAALQWRMTDLLGREVIATHALGYHPSGNHAISLPTTSLPPGVYLWQIRAGEAQLTRRILLTR